LISEGKVSAGKKRIEGYVKFAGLPDLSFLKATKDDIFNIYRKSLTHNILISGKFGQFVRAITGLRTVLPTLAARRKSWSIFLSCSRYRPKLESPPGWDCDAA
jgi:hypothetical protein